MARLRQIRTFSFRVYKLPLLLRSCAIFQNYSAMFYHGVIERLFMLCIGMMVSCAIRGSIGFATSREEGAIRNMIHNDSQNNHATQTRFMSEEVLSYSPTVIASEFDHFTDSSKKLKGNVVKVANRTWPTAPHENIMLLRSKADLFAAGAILVICTIAVVIVNVVGFMYVMRGCDSYSAKILPLYDDRSSPRGHCPQGQPAENFPVRLV